MTISAFNALPEEAAVKKLLGCCHSRRWATRVTAERPFANLQALEHCAQACWQNLDEADWLEAFAAHPLIGDVAMLREKFAARARAEQGQVLAADEAVIAELARLNPLYLDKFGFIFIICATGRTADDMLKQLRQRIGNSRTDELNNAASEQAQITRLRLHQAFEDDSL